MEEKHAYPPRNRELTPVTPMVLGHCNSVCYVPGFKSEVSMPSRSTMCLVDYVAQFAKGKNLFIIGDRHGDQAMCLSAAHSVSQITVIEAREDHCAVMRERTEKSTKYFKILCGYFPEAGKEEVGSADIIFFWTPTTANIYILEGLQKLAKQKDGHLNPQMQVIMAFQMEDID